jgi:hypothetical protein
MPKWEKYGVSFISRNQTPTPKQNQRFCQGHQHVVEEAKKSSFGHYWF